MPEFEHVPYLWSGNDAPKDSYYRNPDRNRLVELVNERKDGIDGLIMVTHLEVAREFPRHYLKTEFGVNKHIREISKGEAVHFDLEGKTYQILGMR